MSGLFDDSRIELTCPNCGHKSKERLGKLKTNPKLPCSSCGTIIQINADQLNSEMKKLDKSFADLRKTLSSFGKKR